MNGDISVANGTFFANQSKGGAGGSGSHGVGQPSRVGQDGDAAGGGLYLGGGSISLDATPLRPIVFCSDLRRGDHPAEFWWWYRERWRRP